MINRLAEGKVAVMHTGLAEGIDQFTQGGIAG